jgi:hypothetical protein
MDVLRVEMVDAILQEWTQVDFEECHLLGRDAVWLL